ncbi:MAG TPA: HEAT repeat domain-containing protein [Polyangiaceae bacterium]|nr:HEAT repeat domain-containing protein [Polyangiaceae bacterium]
MTFRLARAGTALALVLALSVSSQGCNRSSAATGTSASPVAAPRLDWPLLKLLRYDLDLRSASTSTMAGMPFKVELSATVELIPLERQGEKVAMLMRLRSPKLTFGGKASEDGAAWEKELAQPFWFALERGKIVDTRISQGLSGQTVSMLRTISSGLQLTTPTDGSDPSKPWTVREHDSTGEYEASYSASADGTVLRNKQRFLDTLITGKVTPEQRKAVLPQVERAEARLTLSAGLLQKVTSHDEVRTTLLGANTVTVTTDLSLVRQAAASATPEPEMLKLAGDLLSLSPSRAYGIPDARASFDALRAENAKFSDVLVELEAMARDPNRRALVGAINDKSVGADAQDQAKKQLEERASELSKLTGLLRTKPETIRELEAAIAKKSPASSMLLDALSSAGTEAAQTSLIGLLRGTTLSRELRNAAATSLIRVQLASPATVELLTTLVDDPLLRDHAVYGLGTAARRLVEHGEAARSEPLVDVLLRGLSQAKSSDERVRWLRGIANAGSAKALPAVQPLLDDKDRILRQSALEALRLVQDPRVDEIVAERLQKEDMALVRETALRVAELRSPSPVLQHALELTAQGDQDKAVRAAAERLLERWKRSSAQAPSGAVPMDKP